ncbi:hypothetical protein COCVIDRAFT_84415 [Bipolaris victoriae FI3]|uniref:Uncharacterized protein n=1 Tax=Bipolaris victoriae (strain FI3) TaxID=930091 RepID=W7FAF6_BIPV3|nr:hypothetical protein COCVIDRAFT_84415 [Bipolaris victoriae FI3]
MQQTQGEQTVQKRHLHVYQAAFRIKWSVLVPISLRRLRKRVPGMFAPQGHEALLVQPSTAKSCGSEQA